MATWTDPTTGGALDWANGLVVASTDMDLIRENLKYLGGTAGYIGAAVSSTADQAVNASTPTAVAFGNDILDVYAMHDIETNNSRITIPTGMDGKYLISAEVEFASNFTGVRTVGIKLNDSSYPAFTRMAAANGDATIVSVVTPGPVALAATNYVEVEVVHSSSAALNVVGTNGYTKFGLVKV